MKHQKVRGHVASVEPPPGQKKGVLTEITKPHILSPRYLVWWLIQDEHNYSHDPA